MFISVISHDPEIRESLANCVRGLGIPNRLHSETAVNAMGLSLSDIPAGEHFVLLHFASPQLNCHAVRELLRVGQGRFRVIGVGGPLSSERLLEVIRAGAVDYISLQDGIPDQLTQILSRVQETRTQLPIRVDPIYLPIVAPSGGCGATFVAANLACAIASLGESVCALDLKLSGGDLSALLKLSPRHSFQSLARRGDDIDATMLKECLVRHECGVHLLASPEPFSEPFNHSTTYLARIVHTAGQTSTFVLYELEDYLLNESIDLLKLGTYILMPLRMDFISVYRARRCIDYLLRSDISRDRIVLVASRSGRPKDLVVEKVEEVLGLPLKHSIPEDPELANTSVNIGMPVVLSDPKAELSASIFQLARSVARHEGRGEALQPRSRWWKSMHTIATMFGTKVG